MSSISLSTTLAGRALTLETGRLAYQASGAVMATYGETVVLATAVVAETEREGIDFFPLLVDYEEKFYAAGKISGSRFIKRESRPSEQAILNARLIDRPIRPLFPKNFRRDIQVVVTVLSIDKESDPAIVGMIAASAALCLSGAPFNGPIAGVRIGFKDGQFVVNPSEAMLEESELDLVVAAATDRVLMLEAGAKELPEEKVLEAINLGQQEINKLIEFQKEFITKVGPKDQLAPSDEVAPIHQAVAEKAGSLNELLKHPVAVEREAKLNELEVAVLNDLEGSYKQLELKSAFSQLVEKSVRKLILEEGVRPDGRQLDEIRPISIELGLLPRVHGSALFSRGQTQSLTTVTLGAPGEEQMIETMMEDTVKRYMHHYNFPPFSTGEVKPMRGASRRDIGHGALAERALLAVIPAQEAFPYTIRLVSEIVSSNGSSSMAATCGSSLALLQAGVPITAPVAGIAIGMVSDDAQHQLLTDIQGVEDFGGDMDFKVAGTRAGITAIQLDMKLAGIDQTIITETLERARSARLMILDQMDAAISAPALLSKFAPRVTRFKIDPEKLGMVIGPAGKNIKRIVAEAGGDEVTTIDLEDDGTVFVASRDAQLAEKAVNEIKGMTDELTVGETYEGVVDQIIADRNSGGEIGAVVKIGAYKEGMIHISQLADWRVPSVSSILSVGQTVKVKVTEVDRETGRVRLSYKDANPPVPKPEGYVEPPSSPRPFGGGPRRGEFRGPRR